MLKKTPKKHKEKPSCEIQEDSACAYNQSSLSLSSLDHIKHVSDSYLRFCASNLYVPKSESLHNDLTSCIKQKISFKMLHSESKLFRVMMESHGLTEAHRNSSEFNLLWSGGPVKPHVLGSLNDFQKINHFPRSYELTRKDRLCKNIQRMQRLHGIRHFNFIPETYILPLEAVELHSAIVKSRSAWIVKPVALSRGRGIYIINKPSQIPNDSVTVSRYIKDPLLVDGQKCDLRLYVAVTSFEPLVIYLYEEGLVRVATVKYDISDKTLWNPCMHLTNYSVNKYHCDYVKSNDPNVEDFGNKWTFSALLRHLKSDGFSIKKLMEQIENLIIKTILSAHLPIATACHNFVPYRKNCFELYGFDILLDSDLKPWLLEVNLSPSLGCDTPIDFKVKSAMLADLLTLVAIPNVDCSKISSCSSKKYRYEYIRPRTTPSATRSGSEELYYVKNYLEEQKRKNGFVCVFPSPHSWQLYGRYLEYHTELNKALHRAVFGERNKLSSLPDRIDYYERQLKTFPSLKSNQLLFPFGDDDSESTSSIPEDSSIKNIMVELLNSGHVFSKLQARQAFSQYLSHIHQRLMSSGSEVDVKQVNILVKFLQSASQNLADSLVLQIPSQSLSVSDQCLLVAKQLADFMSQYNKESSYISNLSKKDKKGYKYISNDVFQVFLKQARESDLEAVLMKFTQIYNAAYVFLGKWDDVSRSCKKFPSTEGKKCSLWKI